MRRVGPGQNLLLIVEFRHTHYRAKHFPLDNGIFLFRACQQGRLEPVAFAVVLAAASDHLHMPEGFGLIHGFAYLIEMRLRT